MRRIGLYLLLLLAILLPACELTGGAKNAPVNLRQPTTKDNELCANLLAGVNRLRLEQNQQILTSRPELNQLAAQYARQMAASGNFEHQARNGQRLEHRLESAGITGWRFAGENLARMTDAASPASEALRGWQLSATHRDIMFSPDFAYAGTGVCFTDKNECYIVQIYLK